MTCKTRILDLFFWCVLLLSGCKSRNNGVTIQDEFDGFINTVVHIPELNNAMFNGTDTLLSISNSAPIKMIVLIDSTVCVSCKISQIWQWQHVLDFAQTMQGKFSPIFILAPKKEYEHDIRMALKVNSIAHPVFIDVEQKFAKANPKLPQNQLLHTFLLNTDNKVVAAGEPLDNEGLWEFYKQVIEKNVSSLKKSD